MLISIITSTFNSGMFLQQALDSYAKQTYIQKELIVIDGGSADHTLDILQTNRQLITHSVSEKDRGIYDALNKGIQLCNGDIIGILHSDDLLFKEETLAKVAEVFAEDPTIEAVYGDLLYVDRTDTNRIIRNWKSGCYEAKKLAYGWMPPHPALFIKKSCFGQYGNYDLKYKSAADYELILRFLYKHKIKTAYLPQVLVKMRVGGISNKTLKNRLRANAEDREAMRTNGVAFPFLVSALKPLRKINQYILS